MKKNNKGKGRQHVNKLVPSRTDTVTLAEAVEHRYLQLCEDYLRTKFEELVFPSELDNDVILWRTMRVRHKSGDFRNTLDEFKSTTRIADWTLKVRAELTKTEVKKVEWAT